MCGFEGAESEWLAESRKGEGSMLWPWAELRLGLSMKDDLQDAPPPIYCWGSLLAIAFCY